MTARYCASGGSFQTFAVAGSPVAVSSTHTAVWLEESIPVTMYSRPATGVKLTSPSTELNWPDKALKNPWIGAPVA